jgi:alcohol dehydrogenase
MELGLNQLAIGGTAIWIGAAFPAPPVQVNAEKIVRNILQIKGLHNYNRQDLLAAVDFIEKHQADFPFEILVEKEFPLNEADAAFAFAKQYKPVRTGIKL